jgi:hypothetical protein
MENRSLKSYVLLVLAISLVFSSCKKDDDDDNNTPAPTKKEMLTGNNWSIVAYSVEPAIDYDQNGTQENNLMPYLQACNLDDFYNLNADNTYTAEEGSSKCDPNDPQVYENGNWVFNSDETLVVFSPAGGQSYEFSIESLNASRWDAEQVVVANGVTYTFSLSFE